MMLVEEDKIEKIYEELDNLSKEFKRQNDKMEAIIDAIGDTFKKIRKDSEDGFPTVDSDLYCVNPYEAESELRNMVIDNLEFTLMEKINKVREEYKVVE